jgi:hypothetical protein
MKGGEAVCSISSRGIEDGCLCAFDNLSLLLFSISGGLFFFASFFLAEIVSPFLFFSSMFEITDSIPFFFQTSLNVSFSLLQLHLASTDHKIIVSVQTRLYPWFICLTLVLAREDPLSSLRLAAICIHSDVSGSLIARIFDNVFISFLHLTHPCSFPSHLLPHFFSIV